VADGGHEEFSGESLGDEALQCLALDIAAHPPCPMAAGEQQPIDTVEVGIGPGNGLPVFRRRQHLPVGLACIAIRAQYPADDDHPAQTGQP